jgi:site-specific recombinase XerD
VKLPGGLVARLREHHLASPYSQDADLVFATRTGRPLSRHNVYRTIRRSADRASLPGWVSPAPLRHGYARGLLVAGVGIRMGATPLGHRDPTFAMRRYARFLPSDVRALDVDFLDAGI